MRNAAITNTSNFILFLPAPSTSAMLLRRQRFFFFIVSNIPQAPKTVLFPGYQLLPARCVKLGKDEKERGTRGKGRLVDPEEWRWCICNFGTGFFPCQQAKKKYTT